MSEPSLLLIIDDLLERQVGDGLLVQGDLFTVFEEQKPVLRDDDV